MTPQERHQRVKELFSRAAELPAAELEAYLREAGADPEVCAEVKVLLRDAEAGWSEAALGIDAGPLRRAAEAAADGSGGAWGGGWGGGAAVGTRIGRYTITGVIAEGGMGTVYEARQEEPARTVALKVIRAGMISGAALKRFEHESRVLAVLSHPGIAQVYEAGRDGAGLPYFAMEYIPGARNLVEYAEEEGLGTGARLGLLAQVCDAVHHGHQKGVIHRDLKPANILVDTRSGAAQPKVIDFGVARATDSDMTVATLDTRVGEIIGTLRYMSPEQCEGDPRAVDTRSDVFALGTIAYELLTGRMPYDLTGVSLTGVARIIREMPPAPPSSVNPALRGDAETLVLKALEKEPARRYQSAAEMGADIRRLLAHQPLMARPPSAVYLARKFVRRHRVATGAAAAFVAALVLGALGLAWQGQRVAAQRDRAVAERRKAEAIKRFIQSALRSSDPNLGGKQDVLVADAMMQAVKQLDEGEFKDEPEIDADLRLTIAQILVSNGRAEDALPLAERGLGVLERLHPGGDAEVAAGLTNVAYCLETLGRPADALPKYAAALEAHRHLFKGDHADVAADLGCLANCLDTLGRAAEALPNHVAALEMLQRLHTGDHADVAMGMDGVANCLQVLGRSVEALPRYEGALEMWRRLYTGDHPHVARGLYDAACCLDSLGRSAEALPEFEAALEMDQRLFKGDHPEVARGMSGVAYCLDSLGRSAEALPMHEGALEMMQRLFKGDHPEVARGLTGVGSCLGSLGRPAEALPEFQAALEMNRRLFRGDHPRVASGLHDVASCLDSLGRSAEALTEYEGSLKMERRLFTGDHPDVALTLNDVAFCLHSLGRSAEALPDFEAALEMNRRLYRTDHPIVATGLNNVAMCLHAVGRSVEALPMLLDAIEMERRLSKGDDRAIANSMANLARCLAKLDRLPEALGYALQAGEMAARILPEGDPTRAKCEGVLAETQKRLGEGGAVPGAAAGGG